MPEKKAIDRAHQDARRGKSPSTQGGEFIREEINHIRQGKHGARSAKQVIAIGLSKARRAGVNLPPPGKGKVSVKARQQAEREFASGQSVERHRPSRTRSRGVTRALRREGASAASHLALARQARASARKRGEIALRSAALKAVHTKGRTGLRRAARKAARTRAKHNKTN